MKRAAALLLFGLCVPLTAGATEGPAVSVTVPPLSPLPAQGATFSVDFHLTSHVNATITDLGFSSELDDPENPLTAHWSVLGHNAPSSFPVTAFQPVVVTAQVLCRDPNEQLTIAFHVDGTRYERSFFLAPIATKTLWAQPGPAPGPAAVRDLSHAIVPMPSQARFPAPTNAQGPDAEDTITGAGPLRVTGRIMYRRQGYLDVGADGVLVRAWDRDEGFPDLIGSQVTDAFGNFDIQSFWNQSEDPDIYLEAIAANGVAEVVGPGHGPYRFETGTEWNFTGSHLYFGSAFPADPDDSVPLHMLTTASRAWRFLDERGYGGIPKVTYSWPEDVDPPFYQRADDTIHMNEERQWWEASILHEYGHHYNATFGLSSWDGYCNPGGYGDAAPPFECGHTIWCPEDGGVAWNEGIAEFFMNVAINNIENDWGPVAVDRPVETLQTCSGLGGSGSYLTTEGVAAAFMYDVADGGAETDPSASGNGRDLLNFGAKSILDIVSVYRPVTPAAFLAALQNEYPGEMHKIWATAANNGYNFDTTPPTSVASLTSTSHATTGDDPNDIVDLVWTAASDVHSGINSYRIQYADNPSFTGLQERLSDGPVTSWSSESLAPDTYYFRIQPWDNAGNLGLGWTTFGPVTIRPATPADLLPFAGAWPSPVVPRVTTGSTVASAPLPGVLFGDQSATYYNYKTANDGEAAATGTHRVEFYEDGLLAKWYNLIDIPGQYEHAIVDDGPWLVRGGRHTLTLHTDTEGTLAEPDEANNFWHTSYVWLPLAATTSWQTRVRPPDAWGGFDDFNLLHNANCDGVRFTANQTSFHAVVMRPQQLTDDYDLRAFAPSSGPISGFKTLEQLSSSFRPAGCLDAVVNNNALTPDNALDVGVYDFGSETNFSYSIRRFDSLPISAGTTVAVIIPAGDAFALHSVSIPGGWPSPHATFHLSASPALGPIHAAIIDPTDAHWGLDDATVVSGVTDDNGQIVLHFTYSSPLHGIVIWQDPKDNPQFPTPQALSLTIRVEPSPADLKPVLVSGWYLPVMPSYGAPGTAGSVPFPSQLEGNTATTYFNAAIRNDGPNVAGNQDLLVYVDGAWVTGTQISQMAGFSNFTRNYPTAFTVPGGRHTLSMAADASGQISESDEFNNAFARQWVWSPFPVAIAGGWVFRGAPPVVDGGWDHLFQTAGLSQSAWFNSDGLRTPFPVVSGDDGRWVTVAVFGDGTSDVDLRLHNKGDPFQGFAEVRETSTWSGAEPDYVLVNFRTVAPRQMDVGVTRVSGTTGYWYQYASSLFLGTNPAGQYGTFTMGSNQIIRLHEIWLDAGAVHIELENNAGSVDWGMTLHRTGLAFQSRSSAIDGVSSWMDGGGGQGEVLDAIVPESGYYCLAVYRATGRTSGAGRYYLHFSPSTDAPVTAIPAMTRFAGAAPNPFSPRTTLRFELAQPAEVDLDIYDLRGAHVARLQQGMLPAGRHERMWDGSDLTGRRVAGGVYFARMKTGAGFVQTRKLLLMQ